MVIDLMLYLWFSDVIYFLVSFSSLSYRISVLICLNGVHKWDGWYKHICNLMSCILLALKNNFNSICDNLLNENSTLSISSDNNSCSVKLRVYFRIFDNNSGNFVQCCIGATNKSFSCKRLHLGSDVHHWKKINYKT
jgi:hypothetical protein